MNENCELSWEPTEVQINKIIIPAMTDIAKQCAGYINELDCPPEFIGLMLRDIAEAFENNEKELDGNCSCC
tara:strand:- start:3801 stop:4013 length:213 start_codon:yes stop_codon:yes gene_type:complete